MGKIAILNDIKKKVQIAKERKKCNNYVREEYVAIFQKQTNRMIKIYFVIYSLSNMSTNTWITYSIYYNLNL